MHFPTAALFAALALCVSALPGRGAETAPPDLGPWGGLVIQEGGRKKPVETYAREMLLRITGKGSLRADGRKWSAEEFALSLAAGSRDWSGEPLLLVGYRPLVERLGLDPAAKRFPFASLSDHPALAEIAGEIAAKRAANLSLSRLEKEAESVATRLVLYASAASGESLALLPPPPGRGDRWAPPSLAREIYPDGKGEPAAAAWERLAAAFRQGDGAGFAAACAEFREAARALGPDAYPAEGIIGRERFYNRLDPFDLAAAGYGVALLGFALARGGVARRFFTAAGLAAALGAVAVHGTGIALRCLIAGRAPVTNMYESVIWVSLGAAVFALAFFLRDRSLVWPLTAMPVSLGCLMLVARLPIAMPAAIDPLVPVLRSNFWLTTHVLTITLSYAAFALAMALGHAILWGTIRNPGRAAGATALHGALYRVLQLGVLLLAAGTILGGVWANYSWGRFWGWDPKETWALIALLGYLFLLHGRIIGWWGRFGLAVGSVVCFSGILMTWYGVNFLLGAGLHSYGFGIGGEAYVAGFVAAEAAFVAAAAIRKKTACGRNPQAVG
jgi:ABC-type transport system involved in cytochrome c biogenesis permease subunit